MKKLTSLLLILTLVSSCVAFTASADELPGLLFDMDLSECSEGNIDVLDSSGSTSVSGIAPADKTNPPGYGTTGQNTPYLVIDPKGNTGGRKSSVFVTFSDTIPDRDYLTFTTWVCDVNSANRTLGSNDRNSVFGFQNGGGGSVSDLNLHYYPSGSDLYLNVNYSKTGAGGGAFVAGSHGMIQHREQWTHIAVVIKWSANAANSAKSDCEISYYINGTLAQTVTKSAVTRVMWNDVSDYKNHPPVLGIGGIGTTRSSSNFSGYIADLKIYDGVLTAEQINAEYIAEGSGYIDPVDVEGSSLEAYSRADEEFTLTFDGAVDAATLEDVALYMGDTPVQISYISYDVSSKTATYTLHEYLAPGEYTLDVSEVKSQYGFGLQNSTKTVVIDYESEISVGDPEVVYTGEEDSRAAEVSVDVNNGSDSSLTFYLGLVIYDDDGRGIRMPVSEGVSVAARGDGELKVSCDDAASVQGASIIIWCVTEEGVSYPVGTVTPLN